MQSSIRYRSLPLSSSQDVHEREARTAGLLRHLDPLIAFLVIVRCAWIFAAPLRSPDLPLRFAQDDFYYYLKPAQNLAWLHRSTFDGTTLTNGYHPLYFALITIVSFFVHTIPGIFRVLWVVDTISATAIFLLTRRILARVTTMLLSNALAVAVTVLCVPLICDQMEVTLALPLGFAFLCAGFVSAKELTARRALVLGVLGALTFLARLDAGLLILLFVLALMCTRAYRPALNQSNVLGFAAGILPLSLAYFGINLHFFHTLLPVSGMAKQLRHGHQLSLLVPGSFNGTSEFLLVVAITSAVLAWALRNFLQPRERVFLFTVFATPFLFYGLEMLVSDWPIWNWYFYDLRFAFAGVVLLVVVLISRLNFLTATGRNDSLGFHGLASLVACALAFFLLGRTHYKVDDVMVEIQHARGVLREFRSSHPGKYAMGDRAGMFAITSDVSVLQTEGLMEDRTYLEHIRAQDHLVSVLASYSVDYYVAFVFDRNRSDAIQRIVLPWDGALDCGAEHVAHAVGLLFPPLTSGFNGTDGEYLVYRVPSSQDQER